MAGLNAVAALFVALEGRFAKFDSAVSQAANKFEKFSNRMKKIGTSLSKDISVPFGAIGIAAFKASVNVDKALDKIAIATGASGKALAGLEKDFEAVANSTAASSLKATADVISELNTRLGLTGKPLQDLSSKLLTMARMLETDHNGLVKQAAQLYDQWGIATEDQTKVLDMLFVATQKSGIGIEELNSGLLTMGPALTAAGYGIEEGIALLSQFHTAGIDSTAAATGLTKAIKNLADAGVQDIPGALRAVIADIKATSNETSQLDKAFDAFGTKVGAKLVAAIKLGKFELNDFVDALKNADGQIEKTRAQTDGFQETFQRIVNALSIAAKPIEQALSSLTEKYLLPLAKATADALQGLGEAFNKLAPEMQTVVAATVAFLAGIGPAVYVVGLLAAAISFLLSPMGLMAAAIVAGATLWSLYHKQITGYVLIGLKQLQAGFYILNDFLRNVWNVTIKGAIDGFILLGKAASLAVDAVSLSVPGFNSAAGQLRQGLDSIGEAAKNALSVDTTQSAEAAKAAMGELVAEVLKTKYEFEKGGNGQGGIGEAIAESVTAGTDEAKKSIKKFTGDIKALYEALEGDTKKNREKAQREAEKLGDELVKVFDKIDDSMVNFADRNDEVRARVKALITANDVDGLKAYAKEMSTSAKKAKAFGEALEDAFTDFNPNQVRERLRGLADDIVTYFKEPITVVDDLQDKLSHLVASGDRAGLRGLANEMGDTAEHAREFEVRLDAARKAFDKIRDASHDFSNSIGDAVSMLAGNLGFSELSEAWGNAISTALAQAFDKIKPSDWQGFADALGVSVEGLSGAIGGLATGISVGLKAATKEGLSDLQQGIIAGLSVVGGVIGGIYGGPGGAALGAAIGSTIGTVIAPIFENGLNDIAQAQHDIIGTLEGILGQNIIEGTGHGGAFSGFGPDFIPGNLTGSVTNDLLGSLDNGENPIPGALQFGEGWADVFNSMEEDGKKAFQGLGEALTALLGVTEDVGSHIGFILAVNFGGTLDDARELVQLLGYSFEDLQEALLQAAIKGSMTWHEFAVNLQGLQAAFQPGITAVGDMVGTFDNLVTSGGKGIQAIKALKDSAVEAGEAGITSFEDWRNTLIAAGKPVADVDALFQALGQQGITTFDELANASDLNLGLVVADLDTIGFGFQEVVDPATQANDAIKQFSGSMKPFNEETQVANDQVDELAKKLKGLPSEVKTKIVIEEVNAGGGGSSSGRGSSGGSNNQLGRSLAKSILGETKSGGGSKKRTPKPKPPTDEEIKLAEQIVGELSKALNKDFGFGQGSDFNFGAYAAYFATLANNFATLDENAKRMGASLGNALSESLDLSQEAATQLTQFLSVDLVGSLDSARHYVASMGFDFKDLAEALAQTAADGKISWGEFAMQFQSLTDMFTPGIAAVAAYGDTLDNIFNSGGTGFDAIQSIRDMGIEAMEAQIDSIDGLKAALIALGKPAEQVEALFAAITAQGITTTEQLSQVSNVTAGVIVGSAANGGFQFAAPPAAPAPPSDPEEQRLRDRIAAAQTDYQRRRREKELADYLAARKASQGYAKGGIIMGTRKLNIGGAIGRMSEFSPEAIMPLARVGGTLGVRSVPSSGSSGPVSVNYVVNAPNATAGIEAKIEAALRRVHTESVATSLYKVADMARRGGGFAKSVRGRI